MKKQWNYGNLKIVKGMLVMACAVLFFMGQKNICFAETTGEVTTDSAKIRKEANVTSEQIGSSAKGATVTITDEVTDSSGTVWYEVVIDANTKGFIRSDLVSKNASSDSDTQSDQSNDSADTNQTDNSQSDNGQSDAAVSAAPGAESQPDTGMDAQYATVSVEVAKVRSGASTDKSIVDTIPQNTSVVVSGQTDDSSNGKTWYYITFTGTNGAEKTGYIRSDLVELGDMVPVEAPVEEQPEQPVEEQPTETVENKDYEVVYTTNENGEYEWYLYNNLEGNRQKLAEVLAAAHAQSVNDSLDAATVSKQRIIIIILIAVIIVLAVVLTIMIFKLRDAYYEEYEDDEEDEEEEEEEEPARRAMPRKATAESAPTRQRSAVAESAPTRQRSAAPESAPTRQRSAAAESAPARQRSAAPESAPVRQTGARQTRAAEKVTERQMPVKEVTYEETEATVKSAPKRKAKNFLIDDDDFEFEFLNISDKD